MGRLFAAVLPAGGLLVGCHSHDHEHAEVTEHHADRESPFGLDDAEAQAAGQAIYDAQCATCHGADGMGDGELAASLDPVPSDFTMGHADSWTAPTGAQMGRRCPRSPTLCPQPRSGRSSPTAEPSLASRPRRRKGSTVRHFIFAGLIGVTTAACAPESTGDEPIVVLPSADAQPEPEPEPDGGPIPDAEVEPDAAPEPVGLAVLGAGSHSIDAVDLTVIGTAADGLAVPRDLEFDPDAENPTLWVVNRADDSTTIFFDPGTDDQDAVHIIDPYALHFMEEVSSIAFGAPGTFGTCQESRNTYNGQGQANDFMGPSLWPSDLDVYGRTNPDAVAFLGFDLGSHLDMQHESPLCMGIAWQRDNVYWVFEGMTSSIARNDFGEDHGPGYDDHSDGIVIRFAVGEVSRVPDVPSHLVFDHDSGLLYIADTGNARVGSLDTREGTPGANMPVVEPGTILRLAADGAPVETLFQDADLKRPSGLALHEGVLYVGDNLTGRIWGLDLDGEVIDYLDTDLPPGALMGLEVGADGALWITDAVEHRVLRIGPLP